MAVLSDAQREAGWTVVKLEEAVDKIIDHRGRTPKKLGGDWSTSGHRVISALNIKKGVIDQNYHHMIDDRMYEQWMPVKFSIGDVIVTSEAPMGEIARVRNAEEATWAAGQRIFVLKPKKNLVHSRYMYYAFLSTKVQAGLHSRSSGTTVVGIKQKELKEVEIPLPPLEEQERIAGILGSLDDKIEANTRLIQTLDSLGEAVTRKYLKSVQETQKLNDIAHIVMGQSPKGETLNTEGSGVLFFQGKKDFGFRYPAPRTYTTAATRMAEPLDILFSVRAPIGALNRSVEACCVGRGLAAIRSSCGQENTLFYTLKTNPNLWEKFEGEGTIFSAINKKGLSELDIPFSETAISNGVEDFLTSVEQEIFSLEQENLQLAATRDALIKRLIG